MRFLCFLFLIVAARLTAQVPGLASGRVTVGTTGEPIRGARVEVVGRGDVAQSDAVGRFVLRGLEPRTYTIRVRAIGFLPFDGTFEITNGRSVTIDVALLPNVARLDSVVVRERAADAVVFDRAAIEQSGRRNIGELLQSVPGVVVTETGGPGAPAHASIRGSSSSQVLVLVDGTPANSVFSGEADLSRISLERVERVSVIRGASSSRFGARALAGVILIETQNANRGASLDAELGAWNERSGSASVSGRRSAVSGSITAERRVADGDFAYDVPAVRGGGRADRTNAAVTTTTAGGALSATSDRVEARLSGSLEQTSRGVAGSIVQPSGTGKSDERRANAGASARIDLGKWTWSNTLDVTRDHDHFADSTPPFGGRYDNLLTATQLRASTEASIGAMSLGVEHRRLGLHATALDSTAPSSQRLTGIWTGVRLGRPLGAFVLGADASARLDWDSLIRSSELSLRMSVSVSRGPIGLAGSIGNGYSPPSLADQFFHEGVLVRANPNLEPERVRGDMELRAQLRELPVGPVVLRAEVAAYRADVRGMILWSPDFRFVWSPSNFDVRRSGFEVTGGLAFPVRGMMIDLQGTLNRANVGYTGDVLSGQVVYRPRTTGSVRAALGRGALRIESETRYVGRRRTVPGSAVNALDPYWLTDVIVAVPLIRRAWTIDAVTAVTNVFDRPAAMLVDYPFPGRGWRVALRARRAPVHAQ